LAKYAQPFKTLPPPVIFIFGSRADPSAREREGGEEGEGESYEKRGERGRSGRRKRRENAERETHLPSPPSLPPSSTTSFIDLRVFLSSMRSYQGK